MVYSNESLEEIKRKYAEVSIKSEKLVFKLLSLHERLRNAQARKYLMQGAGRRVRILTRCIHNVFLLYPIDSTEPLLPENLTDLDINLHAFFVNVSGFLDNLAWIFVLERECVWLFAEQREMCNAAIIM